MTKKDKLLLADQAEAKMEEALMRLERAVLNRESQEITSSGEQAGYIEQLETENKQMARDMVLMKEKYRRLEKITDSAERELLATLNDLDQMIAQKSLH